jgi:hypothetical protein
MSKFISKVSLIIRAYIWLNRMLFITFGGAKIDSNGELIPNKYLKFYGYLSFTIFTTWNFFGLIYFNYSEEMIIIYKSDPKILYYMTSFVTITQMIHMTANLWYINRNGFRFFEIFYRHKMSIKKNKFILSILWICHILIPVVVVIYSSMTTDLVKTSNFYYTFSIYFFQSYSIIAIWAVSFLTWITSLYFYEFLIEFKQNLRRVLTEISCNFRFEKLNNDLKNNQK